MESRFGASEEEFSFVCIELEKIVGEPSFYCGDAVFDVSEGWVCDGFGGEIELGVVGVAVKVQIEIADDVTKGKDIADEKKGTEDRTLRNAVRDRGEGGGVAREGDELLSVGEVGGEPV